MSKANRGKGGLVSNQVLTAEEFARYKRDHWRIENCLHHVLDEDFLEDKCTAKNLKILYLYYGKQHIISSGSCR